MSGYVFLGVLVTFIVAVILTDLTAPTKIAVLTGAWLMMPDKDW